MRVRRERRLRGQFPETEAEAREGTGGGKQFEGR